MNKWLSFRKTIQGFSSFNLWRRTIRMDSDDQSSNFRIHQISGHGDYPHAAVATDSELCSEIGNDVLENGGSVVDAAISSLLCLGVVNSQHSGIGGGFMMTIYAKAKDEPKAKGKRVHGLVSREVAPGFVDQHFYDNRESDQNEGPYSVAIPGEINGYWMAWQKFGRLPWSELFAPAIKLCREGWPVTNAMAKAIESGLQDIQANPALRKLYLKSDGTPFEEGDLMTNPLLGNTLERIAGGGADEFYRGQLVQDILMDLHDHGATEFTAEDFQSHKSHWTHPISGHLSNGNYTVHSLPPPSSGSAVINTLGVLDALDLTPDDFVGEENQAVTLHKIVESWKVSQNLLSQLGDVKFDKGVKKKVDSMISDEMCKEAAASIESNMEEEPLQFNADTKDIGGTTHLVIIGKDGSAVSVTSTVVGLNGSKIVGSRTGIIFNNGMSLFHLPSSSAPEHSANWPAPYKTAISSTSPSLILDDSNRVALAIGASGGPRIITSITYVCALHLWLGIDDLRTAVDYPRLHCQLDDTLYYDAGISDAILQQLHALGHQEQQPMWKSYPYLGVVQAAVLRKCDQCEEEEKEICPSPNVVAVCDWRKKGEPSGH